MTNQTKKVIAKAMKTEAEKEMEELHEKPNKIFKFVKFMKRDGKDVEGGKCTGGSRRGIRGSDPPKFSDIRKNFRTFQKLTMQTFLFQRHHFNLRFPSVCFKSPQFCHEF